MKRASYRAAIFWMAHNDDTDWVGHDDDGVDIEEAIRSASVTAVLTADLFDVEVERVRKDLRRAIEKREAA